MQWKDTNNFLDFLKMYHEEDRESNWWPAQRFETMQTLELDILFPEFRNTFPPSIMHQDFFCLRDDLPTQPFIIYLVFFCEKENYNIQSNLGHSNQRQKPFSPHWKSIFVCPLILGILDLSAAWNWKSV